MSDKRSISWISFFFGFRLCSAAKTDLYLSGNTLLQTFYILSYLSH